MAVSKVLQRYREQCCRKKQLRRNAFAFSIVRFFPRAFLFSALLQPCNTATLAKDLGIHGTLFSIEEEDPIVLIQKKLKGMEESGELKAHIRKLQQKTKAFVERPKPLSGITKATESRSFYYDPTYIVKEDLKDHLGRIIHKKGTRINPLETVSLSRNLLFFDGDDKDQVAFAKEKLEKGPTTLILVKGAPLALSEELKVHVYFDQSGILIKKLGISHVPSLVTQEGLRLRIESIVLKENQNSLHNRSIK